MTPREIARLTHDEIVSIFKTYPMPFETVGYSIGKSAAAVSNWFTGATKPPPYLEKLLAAIYYQKEPLTAREMDVRDLTALGLSSSTIAQWRRYDTYPLGVQLAAAMIPLNYTNFKPQRKTLININTAIYYRRRGSDNWYAKPVIGKPYPKIMAETMERMIDARMVEIRGWRPYLTKKGRDYAYEQD